MTPLIEKYFDKEKIGEIAKSKNYDQTSYIEFIRFLEYVINDELRVGLEKDYENQVLDYVDEFMTSFLVEREKGMSVEWAKTYSHEILLDNREHALAYAFEAIKKVDREQAITDLRRYAASNGRDEDFIRHFIFLLDVDVPTLVPSVEEQAIEYSGNYKKQISAGKSDLFANYYAYLLAYDENSEFSCFVEASEYENALLAGYTESDARAFADEMSEYIVNHFHKYEKSFGDLLTKLERDRLEKKHGPKNRS